MTGSSGVRRRWPCGRAKEGTKRRETESAKRKRWEQERLDAEEADYRCSWEQGSFGPLIHDKSWRWVATRARGDEKVDPRVATKALGRWRMQARGRTPSGSVFQVAAGLPAMSE